MQRTRYLIVLIATARGASIWYEWYLGSDHYAALLGVAPDSAACTGRIVAGRVRSADTRLLAVPEAHHRLALPARAGRATSIPLSALCAVLRGARRPRGGSRGLAPLHRSEE